MNSEVLQVMKHLYANSREPVWILDRDWHVLWSSDGSQPGDLPAKLGLPYDCWSNVSRPFELDGTLYICRLDCSVQDGLRTATLTRSPQGMDLGLLSGQIQSMLTVCTMIDTDLDSMGIYEERDRLNILAGNILRVYRAIFLRREIERGIGGMWSSDVFCLQTALTEAVGKLPNLLRDTAMVEMTLGEEKQFVRGDVNGFTCAVLAALLLCIHEPEMIQEIFVKVDVKKDKAVLELSVMPQHEKRRDVHEQSLSHPCGTAADQELLELYCQTFGIGLFFADTAERASCRLELPLCTETSAIQLGAPLQAGAGGFFDLVPVMMAGFRVRKRF